MGFFCTKLRLRPFSAVPMGCTQRVPKPDMHSMEGMELYLWCFKRHHRYLILQFCLFDQTGCQCPANGSIVLCDHKMIQFMPANNSITNVLYPKLISDSFYRMITPKISLFHGIIVYFRKNPCENPSEASWFARRQNASVNCVTDKGWRNWCNKYYVTHVIGKIVKWLYVTTKRAYHVIKLFITWFALS